MSKVFIKDIIQDYILQEKLLLPLEDKINKIIYKQVYKYKTYEIDIKFLNDINPYNIQFFVAEWTYDLNGDFEGFELIYQNTVNEFNIDLIYKEINTVFKLIDKYQNIGA